MAIVSVSVNAMAVTPEERVILPNTAEYVGMAQDGNLLRTVSVERDDVDAIMTVYDSEFNIIDKFTVPNCYEKYVDEYDGHIWWKRKFEKLLPPVGLTSGSHEYIFVTRDIFTHDGEWSIVMEDEINDGYYVCNTKGERLFELPVDIYYDDDVTYCGDLFFVGFDKAPVYMTTRSGYIGDEYKSEMIIWKFESTNGAYAPVVANSIATAYPNPLPSGQALTISLPKPADNRTVVTITDMSGRQQLHRNVRQGESEITVSPRFAQGLHIFTVIYSDGTTASGKVVAK